MPFPNPDTQFKTGHSGNPAGYSKGRRVSDALTKLIEEKGLERDLALVIVAMASGQKHLLKHKVVDPETRKEVWVTRTPELGWLLTLLDRTEGKPADAPPPAPEPGMTKGDKLNAILARADQPRPGDEAAEDGG